MEKITDSETPEADKEDTPLTDKNPVTVVHTMKFYDKLKYVLSNTTVEPVLTVFITSSVLAALATQNLNLEKACRVNLNYSDIVCTALKMRKKENYTIEEQSVQNIIASTSAWKSVILAAIPTFLMMFIGAWSDKTGRRKVCMLMPIFGDFMASILSIVCVFFFYQIPVEGTVFLEVIFPALMGGWHTMFLGVFSYLGDITTKEMRTFRFGILSFGMTVGFPLGMAVSGVLLKCLGYYGVFAISATLKFLNFCYVLFYLEDHTWLKKNKVVRKLRISGFLWEFFDYHSFRQTLGIAFKEGAHKRRLRVCLLLLVVSLNFMPISGEQSVMYIFTRYKFNWTAVKYSIYATYHMVTHSMGTMFSISVFSKRMRVDDATLGMISATSKILAAVMLVVASNELQLYMSPLLEILNGTTPVALRSIASKLVSHQELGKVNSLFGIVETLTPLVAVPLYSHVYMATLSSLPGAVFILSVAAMVPALIIFGWFYNEHKKDAKAVILATPTVTIASAANGGEKNNGV